MALDRVRVLKIEKPSTGGTQTDVYPTDINPNEDAVDARGMALQNDSSTDETVLISRDASDNMTFADGQVSGTKTLSDLIGGGGTDDDQVKDNVPVGETFTVKDEYQHITYDEFTVAGEYIVNGEAVVLGGYEPGGGSMTAHALGGAYHTASTLAQLNALVSDATLDTSSASRTPNTHASSHENGNSDEISVAGLSGVLADNQPSIAHALGGAKHTAATLAELNALVSDATLDTSSASRTPSSHASSHVSGGGDSIKLDDLATPDDNTDLNATTSLHGLLPKLGGGTTNFLRADGTWAAPPGGSSFAVFSGYNNAGGGTINATWLDVDIDTETKKTTGFTHSTTVSPEEVEIDADGTYKIDAQMSVDISSGTSRSQTVMRLMRDTGSGFVEVDGTRSAMYNRTLDGGIGAASVSIILDLDDGDKIKMSVQRTVGTSTMTLLADSARLVIVKM